MPKVSECKVDPPQSPTDAQIEAAARAHYEWLLRATGEEPAKAWAALPSYMRERFCEQMKVSFVAAGVSLPPTADEEALAMAVTSWLYDNYKAMTVGPFGSGGLRTSELLEALRATGVHLVRESSRAGVSLGDSAGEARSQEIVHRCPAVESGVTQCCGRSPFELPMTDRLTVDDALVTCRKEPTNA